MPKKNSDTKPWERQIGESEKAFEAFSLYRDMGAERTMQAVADELHKSYTLIRRWKNAWNWKDRVIEYDNDKERQAKKEAEKGLRDMYNRQTKIAMQIQAKALKALDKLDPSKMSPKDVKEYLRMATDLERLNRTLNADQHKDEKQSAASLADTIVAAYERRKGGDGE